MAILNDGINVMKPPVIPDPDPEGTPTQAGEEGFDPSQYTVADVQAYVNEHPDEAEAVLDAEESGKNRVTLVDWLHEKIEEN